ncbi:PREDICTED: uncharacterized protein LOC108540630 [Rhinopithecus bieti]|uniref:uncharacterized protein LOC108540630 n=1 Tax=Rhinopithecus bieti TaxID=61621 RepID=UPI00083C0B5E|nr:PREDICTED: uncharacterized protein LOC108540630 [Rhinopithecus bieti]
MQALCPAVLASSWPSHRAKQGRRMGMPMHPHQLCRHRTTHSSWEGSDELPKARERPAQWSACQGRCLSQGRDGGRLTWDPEGGRCISVLFPDNKDVSVMMSEMDVNAIAGTLKLYFRELPEPLFTDEFYPNFAEGIALSDPVAKESCMLNLLLSLPEANLLTFLFLLDHLKRVAEKRQSIDVPAQPRQAVFGPHCSIPREEANSPAIQASPSHDDSWSLESVPGPGAAVLPAAGGHPCPGQQETEHPVLHRSLRAPVHLQEANRWPGNLWLIGPSIEREPNLPEVSLGHLPRDSDPKPKDRWTGQIPPRSGRPRLASRLWFFSLRPPKGTPSQCISESRPGPGRQGEGSGFYELNL